MIVYVVLMRRWGDSEGHHYIEGVYDSLEKAEEAGIQNRIYRSNKYEPYIFTFTLNENRAKYDKSDLEYIKELYDMKQWITYE